MRVLVPEILDGLAPEDPRARRSRRDLARINAVMRQSAIMARALAGFPAPTVLADLGGGDGRFLLSVAKHLSKRWSGVQALVCDRVDIISPATRNDFARLGWRCESRTGDIFESLPQAGLMMANLFLHHFDDAALKRLLARVADNGAGFVACEPRRNGFALFGAHMVWALGANDVTRHDAVASVRAGFNNPELAALWPEGGAARRWQLDERSAWPFTHVFAAHAV